jgi:2-polyprenyl-6-methoxyphenol hydroxylase-like FAD-dependent oxidoreductase
MTSCRTLRRAIVVGGSMSGLFSALFLKRHGWEVALHERSPVALTGRGAGIMTHPELHRAAAAAGLETSRNFGVAGRGSDHRAPRAPADRYLLESSI